MRDHVSDAGIPQQEWQWWAGVDEETLTEGPFNDRDQAIDAAIDMGGGVIIEAKGGVARLSNHFVAESFLELAEEQEQVDHGNPDMDYVIFDVSEGQKAQLQDMVRAAIDRWQNLQTEPFKVALIGNTRAHMRITPKPEVSS